MADEVGKQVDPTEDRFVKAVETLEEKQQDWDKKIKEVETGMEKFRAEIMVRQNPMKALEGIGPRYCDGELNEKEVDLVGIMAGYIKAFSSNDYSILERFGAKYGIQKAPTNVPYAIPTPLYPTIWQKILQQSVFLQNATRLPMTSTTLTRAYLDDSLAVNWIDAGTAITASDFTLQQIKFTALKLAAYTILNMEDIDDALPGLVPMMQADVASAMAREIDTYGFTHASGGAGEGDGVITIASKEVTLGTAGGGLTPTYAEIWEGIGKLDTVELRGAAFYMHPVVWAYIRGLVDSAGMPIWQPSLGIGTMAQGTQQGTLCGFPVYLVDALPSATATGTSFMLFGNLAQWEYGDRMSLEFAFSDHIKFAEYQRAFRWVLRMGFGEISDPSGDPGETNLTKQGYFVKWTSAAV